MQFSMNYGWGVHSVGERKFYGFLRIFRRFFTVSIKNDMFLDPKLCLVHRGRSQRIPKYMIFALILEPILIQSKRINRIFSIQKCFEISSKKRFFVSFLNHFWFKARESVGYFRFKNASGFRPKSDFLSHFWIIFDSKQENQQNIFVSKTKHVRQTK